jgi:hypothetical protein
MKVYFTDYSHSDEVWEICVEIPGSGELANVEALCYDEELADLIVRLLNDQETRG